jgi:hypothetical protein
MSIDEAGGASAAVSAELGTEAKTVTSASTGLIIRFNNKWYENCDQALLALRSLLKKTRDAKTPSWYRTDIIHEADGTFTVRCSTCEEEFQKGNPAAS